jgi:hypothetical protein
MNFFKQVGSYLTLFKIGRIGNVEAAVDDHDVVILAQLNSKSFSVKNFTPVSGSATTDEEKLVSLLVPPKAIVAGNVLMVYADVEATNSGGNTKDFRMYLNTSDSLTGATLVAFLRMTTQVNAAFMRMFPIINSTTLDSYGGTATSVQTQYNTNSGTTANVTIPNVTGGFYIIFSTQKSDGSETVTIRSCWAKKEI